MSPRFLLRFALLGLTLAGAFLAGRFSHRAVRVSSHVETPSPSPTVREPRGAAASHASDSTAAVAPAARMASAMQVALRSPDRASRLYEFAAQLRSLEPSQFPALFEALRKTRFPDTPELLAMLCSVWAGRDGPAAFAAGRSVAKNDGEYPALHAAIAAWARREPAAVQAALQSAGLGSLAGDEMTACLQGWASADPAAAEAFLRAAGRGDDAEAPAAIQRGYEAVARARIAENPPTALAWYAQLREPLSENLRQAVAAQLSAVDPQAASQWLSTDATAQLGASDVMPILRGLQLSGYDEQFAWAKGLANAETRSSALAAVVGEGAHGDLVSLGQWLAGRSDDSSLTPAISAYALQVVRKSPAAAVTWALSLDRPELRQNTLNTVAAEWITMNPRAAREWAQRTGLVDWEALVR